VQFVKHCNFSNQKHVVGFDERKLYGSIGFEIAQKHVKVRLQALICKILSDYDDFDNK